MKGVEMRAVYEFPSGTLRNATTVNNVSIVANALKSVPGVGQPFLIFNSLPGAVAMVDWQHESIIDENGNSKYVVSSTSSENVTMINDMLANPPLAAITLAT